MRNPGPGCTFRLCHPRSPAGLLLQLYMRLQLRPPEDISDSYEDSLSFLCGCCQRTCAEKRDKLCKRRPSRLVLQVVGYDINAECADPFFGVKTLSRVSALRDVLRNDVLGSFALGDAFYQWFLIMLLPHHVLHMRHTLPFDNVVRPSWLRHVM